MVLFLAGLLEMEWYSFCYVYGIKKNTEPPTINQTQELEILLSSLQAILSTMLIIAVWRVLHMSKHMYGLTHWQVLCSYMEVVHQ